MLYSIRIIATNKYNEQEWVKVFRSDRSMATARSNARRWLRREGLDEFEPVVFSSDGVERWVI